jgi:hypothetical protein
MAAMIPLVLRNDRLAVTVLADNGADIASIIDLETGVDVLFQAPWGRRAVTQVAPTTDSQVDWLARYGGGWQQLVPNAGEAREVDGVLRGYHGEAAVAGWELDAADDVSATLSVRLITAPLLLTRSIRVDGATLHVRDTVQNESPDPVEVTWVQHPAFGAPFIDEHARLTTGARTIITDAVSPGNVLAPDAEFPITSVLDLKGAPLDLAVLPAQHSGRAVFAALTDFEGGWFAIDSPTVGFGIRVQWDAEVFPHAWFWQEINASTGFPWFRRAYVVAVEPANVLPGQPSVAHPNRGIAPRLAPGVSWTASISLTRTDRSNPQTKEESP